MKQIIIQYCDINQKWDMFVDGELKGKYYSLREIKLERLLE